MKEFIIFVCTYSTEIFFSKLRSASLNYNLPSFFTDSYCAGVSNKHYLLTFFIFLLTVPRWCFFCASFVDLLLFVSCLLNSCLFNAALWSPAGRGFCHFPIGCPGSGVVFFIIDSSSLLSSLHCLFCVYFRPLFGFL